MGTLTAEPAPPSRAPSASMTVAAMAVAAMAVAGSTLARASAATVMYRKALMNAVLPSEHCHASSGVG
ncbi:hypothetical protein ACFSLT_11800 [Novosphingobium resinovorum]